MSDNEEGTNLLINDNLNDHKNILLNEIFNRNKKYNNVNDLFMNLKLCEEYNKKLVEKLIECHDFIQNNYFELRCNNGINELIKSLHDLTIHKFVEQKHLEISNVPELIKTHFMPQSATVFV
jgi:hypothetical protein